MDSETCRQSISKNYTQDSAVFRLNGGEVIEYESLNPETAVYVVDTLLKSKTNCAYKDIEEKNQIAANCTRLSTSTVCEVKTLIGYFIVHRSSFGHFEHSVTWARWD